MSNRLTALLLAILGSVSAATNPGTASRTSYISVCLAPLQCLTDGRNDPNGGLVTLSGTYAPTTSASIQAQALAESSPGTIRARSTSTVNVTGTAAQAYVFAGGTLADWVKIDYGPLTGQTGYLWLEYTLDGTVTKTGVSNAFALLTVQVGEGTTANPNGERWVSAHGTTSGRHVTGRAFPFTFGDWFPLYFFLTVHTGSSSPSPNGYFPGLLLGQGTATAAFDNTFHVGALTVTNSAGAVISPTAVTAVSGQTYTVNSAATCTFGLASSLSGAVAYSGVNSAIQVNTAPGCQWTASSDSSWVQVFPLSGTGPGSVSLTVFPNFSSTSRTAQVTIGGNSLSIYQAPNTNTENERFVELLYFNFFGRLPSAAERSFQVTEGLKAPNTRQSLAYNFLTSNEFNLGGRFVAGLYVGLLDRDAEYGGWLFQRNAFSRGQVQPLDLVRNFLNSQEYSLRFGAPDNAAFVRLLYAKILGRNPTDAEVAFQVSNLPNAEARVGMAYSFLNSQEFRIGKDPRLTAFLLYATLLLRDPTPAEASLRQQQIAAGNPVADLMGNIIASPEFAAVLK